MYCSGQGSNRVILHCYPTSYSTGRMFSLIIEIHKCILRNTSKRYDDITAAIIVSASTLYNITSKYDRIGLGGD